MAALGVSEPFFLLGNRALNYSLRIYRVTAAVFVNLLISSHQGHLISAIYPAGTETSVVFSSHQGHLNSIMGGLLMLIYADRSKFLILSVSIVWNEFLKHMQQKVPGLDEI